MLPHKRNYSLINRQEMVDEGDRADLEKEEKMFQGGRKIREMATDENRL